MYELRVDGHARRSHRLEQGVWYDEEALWASTPPTIACVILQQGFAKLASIFWNLQRLRFQNIDSVRAMSVMQRLPAQSMASGRPQHARLLHVGWMRGWCQHCAYC
jgi:hypothetical protein